MEDCPLWSQTKEEPTVHAHGHVDDDSQKKSFMISVVDLLGEASETLV